MFFGAILNIKTSKPWFFNILLARLPKFSSPQILDTKTRKQTHQPKHSATSTSLQTVRPIFESRTLLYQHLLTIFIFTDFFHRLQKNFAGGQFSLYLCLIDTLTCEVLTSKKSFGEGYLDFFKNVIEKNLVENQRSRIWGVF